MSGFGSRRSEEFHTMRTRQFILQNPDGTFPPIGSVLSVNSKDGLVSKSLISSFDQSGNVIVRGNTDVSGSLTVRGNMRVTNSMTLPPVVYGSGMTIYGYITWGGIEPADDKTSPIVASAPSSTSLLGMDTLSPVRYVTVAPYTTITFNGELQSNTAYTCNNSTSSIPSVFNNTVPTLLSSKKWYVYRYNSLGELLDDGYYMGATNSIQNISGGGVPV